MKNIYLLHGWTYSLDKWQPFIELLKKENINPIQLKIPGLTAPLTQPWSIANYIKWLNKQISNQKEKIILLGHSNGGRLALNFAQKYPQKISHLILIDSGGIYDNSFFIKFKRRFFKTLSSVGKKFTDSGLLNKILYKIIGESDYNLASPVMRQTMINLLKSDETLSLIQIRIPVTIIWGKHDAITPLSHAHKLHSLLSNSELHIIDGARHAPFFSHSRETTTIIMDDINKTQIEKA